MIGIPKRPRDGFVENMRATIPKPVIAAIAVLPVVPTAAGTETVVNNITAQTPAANDIRVPETRVGTRVGEKRACTAAEAAHR